MQKISILLNMILLTTSETYICKSVNILIIRIQKNMQLEINKNMNIYKESVSKNNRMYIIEYNTIVDTRDTEMSTIDTGGSMDMQFQENNEVTYWENAFYE